MKKDCAFQYYKTGLLGTRMVEDTGLITVVEAKALWNKHYEDMLRRAKNSDGFEVAIWVNMDHSADYTQTMIHLKDPDYEDGALVERVIKKYPKFS